MYIKDLIKTAFLTIMPDFIIHRAKKYHYARYLRTMPHDFEPDARILKYYVSAGDLVIDIGANIGEYTCALAKLVGKQGTVYSIEPIPNTYDILQSNINRLMLENIVLVKCGISDRDYTAMMEIPKFSSGAENYYEARVLDAGEHNGGLLRRYKIQMTSLDSLLSDEQRRISFIKIDVEGHELASIRGAMQVVRKSRPAMLMEISGDPEIKNSSAYSLFKLLKQEGYSPYFLKDNRLKQRKSGDKSTNYLFLTEDHNLPESV